MANIVEIDDFYVTCVTPYDLFRKSFQYSKLISATIVSGCEVWIGIGP
jgi:hypothetical protein